MSPAFLLTIGLSTLIVVALLFWALRGSFQTPAIKDGLKVLENAPQHLFNMAQIRQGMDPEDLKYAASKGGVAQLTKALANEWAPKGIQVNAIAPGYFATTNTEALQADETRNRQILERIPAARWGQPQDLAGAALYLSSPASNYVTGTVLTVDGGWMGR